MLSCSNSLFFSLSSPLPENRVHCFDTVVESQEIYQKIHTHIPTLGLSLLFSGNRSLGEFTKYPFLFIISLSLVVIIRENMISVVIPLVEGHLVTDDFVEW